MTLIELKNNFDAVLSEYSPTVNLIVNNTLADDGSEDSISLHFWTSYHRTLAHYPRTAACRTSPGDLAGAGKTSDATVAATTLPTGNLNGWHQGMMTLQKLSERLNGLDEHKGKYMTVSELKSVVYSAMQLFNQSIPAEEQLWILAQSPVGQPRSPAAEAQAEMHLKQLIARYADIKQNASKLKGVNDYE